jgi:hypothetical protein
MSDDAPIYVDASLPTVLEYAGRSVDCPTAQEAVMEWHRLPPNLQTGATIRVNNGLTYTASEIPRLHYGPAPSGLGTEHIQAE